MYNTKKNIIQKSSDKNIHTQKKIHVYIKRSKVRSMGLKLYYGVGG